MSAKEGFVIGIPARTTGGVLVTALVWLAGSAIVALAQPGVIRRIEVDTAFFKGNYPDRCSIQAAYVSGGTDSSLITQSMFWPVLLGEQKLQMDKQHFFEPEIAALGPVTHVRLNIIPDGGVSRLRLWGTLDK